MSAAPRIELPDLLEQLNELPTLPGIIYEIRSVIDDPMSSTADVERVMANDPSLTTQVLRLVNSAYYSIPGGVTQLSRAIAYLGFDTIHQLVLSTSIIKTLQATSYKNFKIANFWKHSLGVAIASETIAQHVKYSLPSDLFTCGLVHDIGKIALYSLNPEVMLSIVETAYAKHISYRDAEKTMGLSEHTEIGRKLSELWQLPVNFQHVVEHHHEPDPQARGPLTADVQQMIDIVFLGNLLTHALKFGDSGHPVIMGAPKEILVRLSFNTPDRFKALVQDVKTKVEHTDSFLDILGIAE